jgi:hypothetical protein
VIFGSHHLGFREKTSRRKIFNIEIAGGISSMKSAVRIIKRGRGLQSSPLGHDEKTARQCEREIASTVKNWIAEFAQRRRVDEHSARTQFCNVS